MLACPSISIRARPPSLEQQAVSPSPCCPLCPFPRAQDASLQDGAGHAAPPRQAPAAGSKRRFANSALREFWLLLGRAWRQSSRARIEQVRRWAVAQTACTCVGSRRAVSFRLPRASLPAGPLLQTHLPCALSCPAQARPGALCWPAPGARCPKSVTLPVAAGTHPPAPSCHPQIISTIQTLFVAALLAWLYSGMSQSEPGGLQDEIR